MNNKQKAQMIAHQIASIAYRKIIKYWSEESAVEIACACYCAAFVEGLAHLRAGAEATVAADAAYSAADQVYNSIDRKLKPADLGWLAQRKAQ
jgi:hypothetical protein